MLFFDKNVIHKFILNNESKNKSLVTTHMNEILKACSLSKIRNVESLARSGDFSLKRIPEIRDSFCLKSTPKQNLEIFKFQDIVEVINQHKNFDHSCEMIKNSDTHFCRLLFQACTGVRVGQTYKLKSNVLYLKKSCTNCSHLSICKYPTVSCLPKLKFYKTKNKTPHIVPLLYSVYDCFKFLLLYESIFYLNDVSSFTDFLR